MTINKKIKRTMMESKSQYLGSLALIVLSCLLFTMFNLLSENMSKSISSFEKNYVQEDADFMSDQQITDISDIESKFNVTMEEGKTFDYQVSENKVLRIFSENTKVNIPAIIEGKALTGDDILIDPAYAKANDLTIGDSINIQDKEFQISGYLSIPNYIYPLKSTGDILTDSKNFGVAMIGKDAFNEINQGNSFYSVRFNDRSGDLDNGMVQLKDYLRSRNVTILAWTNSYENPRITMVTTKLNGISQISSKLPIAILLLTCILTGIVMWRMVKREAVIIGTLYALGYKKRQIQNHYLRYPLAISLIGGIVGTILGSLLLSPMLKVMLSYFNMPLDTIDFSIKYVVISVFLPVIFLCAAGYLVVGKALKSSPLELMRGGKENNKVGFLERYLKLDKLKFSTKFKIREQLRSIARSSFLLLGVILATMLLLLGFTAKSSLDSLIKTDLENAFQYNYSYVFRTIMQGKPESGEAFMEIPFTLQEDNKTSITIYGISPNSQFVSFKDKSGNSLSKDQIIMTSSLADKLKVNAKDTIKVSNKLDSKDYSITIDSIANSNVGNYIYIPIDKFNSMFHYPQGSYLGVWSADKLNIPEEQLLTTVTKDELINAFNTMTAPIQSVVGAMSFLSFLIGLIVIYVVTSLIIEENKENISLLKIVGYRKKEVYSMVLNSSTIFVIIGYILGIPLILSFLGAMFKSLTKEMTISLPMTISYTFLIVGFVIIYLTYEISKALSKRKINRISMNEILKSRLE